MKLDDDLSHLDFEVGSVCENGKCTHQAVYVVRIHMTDHCNKPKLDVDGNKVFTLCPTCTKFIGRRMSRALSELDDVLDCRTCGRPIRKLHDIYGVESLVRR